MEEIGVQRSRVDIEAVQLRSELLKPFSGNNLSVDLFGHKYSAPFRIAPVGLQGLTPCSKLSPMSLAIVMVNVSLG